MPIFLRINGVRIKILWVAVVFLLLWTILLFILCVPSHKRTVIAYIKAYIWEDFLVTGSMFGIQEYDVYGPVDDPYSSECLRLPLHLSGSPSPWICIHDPEVDRFVSGYLKEGAVWETDSVGLFQELLENNPELGVVDIGANIGKHFWLVDEWWIYGVDV